MCGILFINCDCKINLTEIFNRGPDNQNKVTINNIRLFGCVLHQQGSDINIQPLKFRDSLLLWNGENYQVSNSTENDGLTLIRKVEYLSEIEILNEFSRVRGPFATIYIRNNEHFYFGRDVLGRRSLLCGLDINGKIVIICSVIAEGCKHVIKWIELPALGMFKASLKDNFELEEIQLFPYEFYSSPFIISELEKVGLSGTVIHPQKLNTNYTTSSFNMPINFINNDNFDCILENFLKILETSVYKRVTNLHRQCSDCVQVNTFHTDNYSCDHSKVAILFSGGIDSAVVAVLADRYVPENDSIDLLNVSFSTKNKNYCESPDRKSGLVCLEELKLINPDRKWKFVEIDIGSDELNDQRKNRIAKLIHPCDSVLDDSIGCALWFAARGIGRLIGEKSDYKSPSRVVLTGIGADELMAGYSRHRCIFDRYGYDTLESELVKELHGISSRNMGRDDRVISSHGKEGRFPFLDDDVVSFLMSLPIKLKCDLTKERGLGEKMILRLLARDYLKLSTTWTNHKRAIQFGSQIAKVDRLNKGEKASKKCDRLDIN